MYTIVKRLLNERPNPIFLNAGDNFQGSFWYTLFKHNVTSHFFKMLPTDVYVSLAYVFYFHPAVMFTVL